MKRTTQKVNIDFPIDILKRIDKECERLGVTRQSWMKIQLAMALDESQRQTRLARTLTTRPAAETEVQS